MEQKPPGTFPTSIPTSGKTQPGHSKAGREFNAGSREKAPVSPRPQGHQQCWGWGHPTFLEPLEGSASPLNEVIPKNRWKNWSMKHPHISGLCLGEENPSLAEWVSPKISPGHPCTQLGVEPQQGKAGRDLGGAWRLSQVSLLIFSFAVEKSLNYGIVWV